MLKTLGAACMSLLMTPASAYHPFVGANSGESAVARDDGVSMKLTHQKGQYNKYSTVMDDKTDFKTTFSYSEEIRQMLFGKTRA